MESSEEEDDFPSIESIIPQSKVDSLYQSHTEKVRSLFISQSTNNAYSETLYLFTYMYVLRVCVFFWIVVNPFCLFFRGLGSFAASF